MKKGRSLRQMQYELFLLPAILAFTAFTVVPLLKTLVYSFTDFDGVLHTYNFVGLRNYFAVFRDDGASKSSRNDTLSLPAPQLSPHKTRNGGGKA